MPEAAKDLRRRLIAGFPPDLPADLIDQLDDLAARELRGEAAPSLLAAYVGEDGRRKTLVWQPEAASARTLRRCGIVGGDAPGAA